MSLHIPVMLTESINYLVTNRSGTYFDATIGYGGHASELLKNLNSNAILVGTDKDKTAFLHCKELFSGDFRVRLFNTDFTDIKKISMIEFINGYDGIFADLGVSSVQLDEKNSGFTYRKDTTLDLRMDKSAGIPAYKLINKLSQTELYKILKFLGEVRQAKAISKKIVEQRTNSEIITTFQLRDVIESVIPKHNSYKTISKVFQAFRIYVNQEIEKLKLFLEEAVGLLKEGGRIVIISYHSLEDRIVKEFFKYESLDCVCPPELPVCVCDKKARLNIITRKPITPSEKEVQENRRARSAKMRVAEKI